LPPPIQKTIDEVATLLNITPAETLKTLIVLGEAEDNKPAPLVALVLRGDHTLNEIKAVKVAGIAEPLTFAPEERILAELGAEVGSLGPVGLNIRVIADRAAAASVNFTCGANKTGVHIKGMNWSNDGVNYSEQADLRNVVVGDPSPDGKGTLEIKRGIEVGHIFQLGTKYSEAMNATVLDENGKSKAMIMGCYGIGVSRIVASAIEQNNDDNGIIWPDAIAPFHVAIVPINMQKSEAVANTCEELYKELRNKGYDVLLMDEPKARLGAMLADVELIGIPHRVVVGDRGLGNGELEYKGRRDAESQQIDAASALEFLISKIKR
jgi:Prolyl-tRNA synthetase